MDLSTTHTLWHGNVSSELWQRNFLKGLKLKGWLMLRKKWFIIKEYCTCWNSIHSWHEVIIRNDWIIIWNRKYFRSLFHFLKMYLYLIIKADPYRCCIERFYDMYFKFHQLLIDHADCSLWLGWIMCILRLQIRLQRNR